MNRQDEHASDRATDATGAEDTPRRPYTPPRIVYRETLEVVASACNKANSQMLGMGGPCAQSTTS